MSEMLMNFAGSVRLPEKLAVASAFLKELETTTRTPPQVGEYCPCTLHEVYSSALAEGIDSALRHAHIDHANSASKIFAQEASNIEHKDKVGPARAIKFFNSHLPVGPVRLSSTIRLPNNIVKELSSQQKSLFHGAQNLGYHDARLIVEKLGKYMENDSINPEALRKAAADIYKEAAKGKNGIV